MNLHLHLMFGPIVALIAGILILVVPRLLNYIVAIYLIVIGLVAMPLSHKYGQRQRHRILSYCCF